MCMFLGASAGSTGGMKCLRIVLCFKYCYKELFSLIHPRAVTHVKIGGKTVPDDVMRSVLGFLALYVGLSALSSVVLAWCMLLGRLEIFTVIILVVPEFWRK